MASFHEEDEEIQFYDAQEDIASSPDCLQSSNSQFGVDYCILRDFKCEVWSRSPQSVQERRSNFLNWMGLNSDQVALNTAREECGGLRKDKNERIMKDGVAVLGTSSSEDEFSSMLNFCNDGLEMCKKSGSKEYRIVNLGGGIDFGLDVQGKGGEQNLFGVSGLGHVAKPQESENTFGSLPEVEQPQRTETKVGSNLVRTKNGFKNRWLSKLRSMSCMVGREGVANNMRLNHSATKGTKVRRIKVQHCRKQWKELSAVFIGQDIQAHEGPILTMKFSLDGQYLATAGEDRIVRVWQVVEDSRSNELDIPKTDPSSIYFTLNKFSELAPFIAEKEKLFKLKSLRKTPDSACVIFPPKVFKILEKPLHEFHGHTGEILDLSWSSNNCLLSSSIDKTVRLWQVGSEHCLKVFPHSNYVTCVQFNPLDNSHMVTGSIDGKVRIWAITGCQVVNWTDIKDIVTAVCYHPNGQGVIVGSMAGTCHFYDTSDDHFQLEARIAVHSKHSKKSAQCKRITGFQFLPQDPSKLMVTCADSKIRILHGINVVGKYKGIRNKGNQLIASFTSDGTHVVSTSEDSNIYVWNRINQEEFSPSRTKKIRSWERFISTNASVALPWSGLKLGNPENQLQIRGLGDTSNILPISSPASFSLGQEFVLDSFPKGSATWPEEKLLSSSPQIMPSTVHKSDYKFLRTCQSKSSSHAWDLVIVTAGWDGWIRSFHNYGLPVAL